MSKVLRDVVSYQADVIKALGHPLRIRIVDYLKGRDQSVTGLIEHFGVDASVVSRQLAILKRAGILASRKSGLNVYYSVAMSRIPEFLTYIAAAVKRKFA